MSAAPHELFAEFVPAPWWRRKGVWVFLIGVVAVFAAGAFAWRKAWPARVKALAQQHTDAGFAAWREGKLREAEIAFASALALDPQESRPALLQARMWLATGRPAEAVVVFHDWLARTQGEPREQIVAIFRDALVCAGRWGELAEFSHAELVRRQSPDPRLLGGLIEAARLARWGADEFERVSRTGQLEPVARGLLRAQIALNAGDRSAARTELSRITQPLAPVVSLIAARLWLRAGDRTAARLVAARVTGELRATEILVANIVLSVGDDGEWNNARRDLQVLADEMQRQPALAATVLDHVVGFPDAEVAHALSEALRPNLRQLPPEVVSGMWFYCSLSGAETEVPVWREQLGSRFGLWPISLNRQRLDERVFLFVANAVPLSRYMLDSLLASLPAAAVSARGGGESPAL
jgi:hypothetical protein